MKFLIFFFLNLHITVMSFAQQDSNIKWIEMPITNVVSVSGDLAEGNFISDISWAWNSAVACFPQTQSRKFTGHHVLYAIDLPAYTEYEIWVEPIDKNANFSIYAYQVGTISPNNTVPNLSSCIRCEADHKWDYKKRGQVQDHTRRVKDILATTSPYQVVISVVGAEGLASGGFQLYIKKK
jgi:hypothetical protein